jgi:AcrR family transcriptional regulator
VTDIQVEPTAIEPRETRTARRGPERREAICEAVFELLGEVGYDRMTMDAVAMRAHASKATIYRTWPDKPGLVAEALAYRFGATPMPPDTGTLRGDLMDLMILACEFSSGPDAEVMTGVMTAASRNAVLARAVYECTYASKHVIHETIIRRAVERGDLSADPDPDRDARLLHEVVHAMFLARHMTTEEPTDEVFARHVVDDILLPVLTDKTRSS